MDLRAGEGLLMALGEASSLPEVEQQVQAFLGARFVQVRLRAPSSRTLLETDREEGCDGVAFMTDVRGRVPIRLQVEWGEGVEDEERVRFCLAALGPVVALLERQEECRRLQADLAKRDFHLYAVSRVGRDLGAVLDLDEVLEILVDILAEVLTIRFVGVLLKDEGSSLWVTRASHVPLRDRPELAVSFQETEGVWHWLKSLGWESRIIEDFRDPAFNSAFPDAPALLEREGVHFLVPLLHEHRLLGLLVLGARMGAEAERPVDKAMLSVLAPLASHAVSNARFYKQAIVDDLTGLHAVRYFKQRLAEELKRGTRYAYPVSLIVMDIDGFKGVNDEHGHLTGDRLLQEVAGRIRSSCRVGVDLVARYGGDEFVILLPQTPLRGALVLAERMRRVVERQPFTACTAEALGVTVSCGVAAFPDMAQNAVDLFEHADQELLRAKREGRNRVCARGACSGAGSRAGAHERSSC